MFTMLWQGLIIRIEVHYLTVCAQVTYYLVFDSALFSKCLTINTYPGTFTFNFSGFGVRYHC